MKGCITFLFWAIVWPIWLPLWLWRKGDFGKAASGGWIMLIVVCGFLSLLSGSGTPDSDSGAEEPATAISDDLTTSQDSEASKVNTTTVGVTGAAVTTSTESLVEIPAATPGTETPSPDQVAIEIVPASITDVLETTPETGSDSETSLTATPGPTATLADTPAPTLLPPTDTIPETQASVQELTPTPGSYGLLPTPTPSPPSPPTATPTVEPTATPTASPTETEVPTPTMTHTPAPKPTATPTRKPANQVTANSNANLRAGPGTDYGIVGGLQAGDQVIVSGRNAQGDWYQLESGEWIAAFLVDDPPGNLSLAAVSDPEPDSSSGGIIAGMSPEQIMVFLEQSGLACGDMETGDLYYSWSCENNSNNVKYWVILYSRTPSTLDFINSSVLQFGTPSNNVSVPFLASLAEFAAPASAGSTARSWVEQTIPTILENGDERTNTFGGIAYSLFGWPPARTLIIGNLVDVPPLPTETPDPGAPVAVPLGGNIFTGVKVYYGTGPTKSYVFEILGGSRRCGRLIENASGRGVKVRYPDGTLEWKDRGYLIHSGYFFAREDDPALDRLEWYEYSGCP